MNERCRASRRPRVALADDHHDALRLWLRLLTCTMLIEGRIRSRLRERFATTLPRFDLMAQLERHPEGLRMGELSRRMMVTGGNVTGITAALVAEGLVERRAIPGDRRAHAVRLTAAGKRAVRRDGRRARTLGAGDPGRDSAPPTATGCTALLGRLKTTLAARESQAHARAGEEGTR